MADQAYHLDHIPELDLVPAAAHGRLARRLHEVGDLVAQHAQMGLDQTVQLLVQR
jgi:hypothetical protein